MLRYLSRALAGLGLLLLIVTIMPPRAYVGWLSGPWPDARGRVLIVLAADGVDGQTLGQGSYWRSVYALWAWREGGFQEVLLSGSRDVTEPMRLFLVGQGVPESAVVLEQNSRSTRENALMSAQVLASHAGPYVLLTSDYHMWRAQRAFRKVGLAIQPRPIPDAGKRLNSWSARWGIFIELFVETAKIAGYWLRGWI